MILGVSQHKLKITEMRYCFWCLMHAKINRLFFLILFIHEIIKLQSMYPKSYKWVLIEVRIPEKSLYLYVFSATLFKPGITVLSTKYDCLYIGSLLTKSPRICFYFCGLWCFWPSKNLVFRFT